MQKREGFNIGIALLKVWMCFEVILVHFWDASDAKGLFYIVAQLRLAAVPIFMIISFYYLYPSLCAISNSIIKKRMFRLIWPQIGWALIYWIFDQNKNLIDLFLQIIFGHRINRSMWFQFSLIILTSLFFIVFYIFRKCNITYILLGLMVLSFILQFSTMNYYIVSHLYELMSDDTLSAPIGRTIEAIPWAVIGIFLNKYNIVDRCKEKKLYAIVLFVISFIPIIFNKFIMPKGFGYSGLGLCIVGGAFVVFFASVMDFDVSDKVANFIKVLSKPTLGIYCCQGLLAELVFYDTEYQSQSMLFCIGLFVICWCFCYIVSKLPFKYIKLLCS